ncbi:MAG: divergent PAP2 family protein [Clostridia bacterium]|nr:divergent PAP2 family protein [Clostridia bacterium]
MNFWNQLINNFPLVCAGTGWLTAQILKVFTGIFKMRQFSITALLFGNGGMPSSHSASVCALAVSCALAYGVGSGYFAIAFLFAIIVMGDAAGVRAETGKQAKVLNRIMKDLFSPEHQGEVNQNLKELVGHTPLQVVMGALLGIALPFLMALIPLYRVYLPL